MDGKQYVFIGNRYYVLKKMLHRGCDIVKIFAAKDSFLSRELDARKVDYSVIPEKQELIDELIELKYDMLVSNGCPYILPISEISDGHKKFVNIHPSLLPDLKGKNPINGAILFSRKHGVTCHYMDDGIDTGSIIEQIEIPITDDLNLDLLYKLSFMAEGEVFEKALNKGFKSSIFSHEISDPIYYSRKEDDYYIKEKDSFEVIDRKVRAFNSYGQYARIMHNDVALRVTDCSIIFNSFVVGLFEKKPSNTVVDKYGKEYFLLKTDKSLVQFRTLDIDNVNIGDKIFLNEV